MTMMFLAALTNLSDQAMAKQVEPGGVATWGAMALLIFAVGLAFAFEFVNGFHDTANAVATVIYTHSLKPWIAVVWSGCWNLIGVLLSSGGIAFGVLALLPVEMVLNVGSSAGFAMVFALLLSAMIWNLGTWYLGLPASSTHSLFGSIIGVGLANAMLSAGHDFGDGVNWAKLRETLLALLISPVIGFVFAGGLLLISKRLIRWPELYNAPQKDKAPPPAVRALLILTCTGVSYGHGSNDGQKGMGLVLLILIGILPGVYALNPNLTGAQIDTIRAQAQQVQAKLTTYSSAAPPKTDPADLLSSYLKRSGVFTDETFPALIAVNKDIIDRLQGASSIGDLSTPQRSVLRRDIYLTKGVLAKLETEKRITDEQLKSVIDREKDGYIANLTTATQFIPFWVKLGTACALGLGTMIGWKRIVVTVGEKIGKTHLTYAQGASAELIAFATIELADSFHLPVSTTHVLSSGVAGTMAANRSGLQMETLRNLLLAWVLTLPVCMFLGAGLFSAGLLLILHESALPVVTALLVISVIAFAIWKFRFSNRKPAAAPAAATAA